ncbi:pyridoxal phosphate-dependent aminotransferase [Siminovitchia fortis]|uniref:Pyridoxal phosphate-dependent aminotransferase n=1 Tax=Siminovitchia fortis TaxID=254758 RepID=A0A443IU26_9BACI|nr:pyridoxal phosphate-dependent aminotransferase [Siminovitchia fortis]RWR11205.1 pyridoxal phosphate-dependent aminotransferase [Siminovitchia fortis]WHY80380.1 pyridoxal phosphate-dependent aminotransferase [Siminovitchia fortis]
MKTFEQSRLLKSLPKQFFASLVEKVNSVRAEGHDVINLGQGNPDQPTPQHIVERLKLAADHPENHQYPPFRGKSELKQAAADFYLREYGVSLDPGKEIAILFGGKAGLVELPQCLLDPGDTMLVPDPGYPDYWSGAALAKVHMEMMPLKEENDFLPSFDDIPEDTAGKAKMMFLNYPNNPTGAVATEEFFRQTVEYASARNICVVHDFAYGGIGFDGKKPVSFLQAEGAKETGVEIYTFSKTYNMAGWRVAFAAGNASVIEAINLMQDHLYVSLFGAVQDAAAEALLGSQRCAKEISAMYEKRRDVFISSLREIGWDVRSPKGSFFAWLKVPQKYTSEEFTGLLLEKAHVAVAPGIGFGEYGEGYVRVGLLTSEERLREAALRIKKLGIF